LSGKVQSTLRYKRELFLSGLVFVWIVVSGIWSLPPLAFVSDIGESIKDSWVSSPDLEPPFGHAELVSLKTFCKKQRIPLDKAVTELRNEGFEVRSAKDTLAEIAETKDTSGMGVYAVIKKLESRPKAVTAGTAWTPEKIEETFAGTSLGKKTFGQTITTLGIDPETARRRLKAIGIEANDNDKLKTLADKNETTPIKIMSTILIEQ
jgi:hypothetical protein